MTPIPHAETAAALALLESLGVRAAPLTAEPDNAEYGGAVSDAAQLRFRVGKVTPRKVGLFVTVWRRAADGSTEPLPSEDGRTLVVAVREGERFGLFAFDAGTLRANGITSAAGRGGKRGFRVYPPWSATGSAQATRTQRWQCEHFLLLGDGELDEQRARRQFGLERPDAFGG